MPGDEVGWAWGAGLATGIIESTHPERTEIISNGSRVVRNGNPNNPAVIVRHKSGNQVLKLSSELQKIKP
jgi:hypothetical protein